MTRLKAHYSAVFYFAAIHLLLFSICPVSSIRIYQTKDAVVIEVDGTRSSNLAGVEPPTRSARSSNYRGNPVPIPMPYTVNPYYSGLYNIYQQPNFLFWPYQTLYKPSVSSSSSSDVHDVVAETSSSAESFKQQNITCGVGPDSPPQRKPPTVGIVGGSEAIPNSWPFVVGLKKNNYRMICGGTLISTTRVLTAAHCVNKLSVEDIDHMTVSLGMHIQGDGDETFNDAQQTRRVSRVVYHKDYNAKTQLNDVAILTIDPPVSYSTAISPVCLPRFSSNANQFLNQDAAIMGWGRLETNGVQPDALQQATVKVISNAVCAAQYSGTPNKIFNQHVCAAAPGKDSCQGDSGGPLVVQTTQNPNSWTQVGITSFGAECASAKFAGVYASVAFFRNWIDSYMKP